MHRTVDVGTASPQYAALVNLGNALVELRRADEALPCFERALALQPGVAATLYRRGCALLQPGDALGEA